MHGMGKKPRRIRTIIKSKLRKLHWFENEFGELKRRMTKGDARSQLWAKRLFLFRAMDDVVKITVERARKDILNEKDRIIFTELSLNGAV